MSIILAKKCFKENLDMFSDPKEQAEKYNLYTGLLSLARTIEEIESKLRNIENQIRMLQR